MRNFATQCLTYALLAAAANSIYTELATVTMSSQFDDSNFNYPGCLPDHCLAKQAADNDLMSITTTENGPGSGWINIQLAEPGIINTVIIFLRPDANADTIGLSSIRVGADPNPNQNAECYANVDRNGVFICGNPLSGNYVGILQTSSLRGDLYYSLAEIRAYAWKPFDGILSAD